MKSHTTKIWLDSMCGERCDGTLYTSGGVLHTVDLTYPDGRQEKRSFRGKDARKMAYRFMQAFVNNTRREKFLDALDEHLLKKLTTNDLLAIADKAQEIFGYEGDDGIAIARKSFEK